MSKITFTDSLEFEDTSSGGVGLTITGDAIQSESFNPNRIAQQYFVGPHGWEPYSSVQTAMADLADDATEQEPVVLSLTGDLTEPVYVDHPSHVYIDGNGHTVTITDDGFAWELQDPRNILARDFTVKYAGTATYSKAIRVREHSDDSVVFQNVTAIGQDSGDGGIGWQIRNDTSPRLINCKGVGGDGGAGADGIQVVHSATPQLIGCEGYGGDGGTDCRGLFVGDSAAPEISGGVFSGGVGGVNCYATFVTESASPTITGITAKNKRYSQFFHVEDGAMSEVVNPDTPTYLESIHYRILQTGGAGSTVDIGTSPGGSNIVAGASTDINDGDVQKRIYPDYNQATIGAGSEIYVTPSSSSAILNVRYTVAANRADMQGLYFDTRGPATISSSTFLSGRCPTGYIGDRAITAKRYSLGNCTFRSDQPSSFVGLEGQTDDATADPIRNCAIFGGTTNLSPQ